MTEVNRKDESIAKYLVNKSEIRYKYLSKFVLLLLVIFLSFDALSAECMEHFNDNVSNGRNYKLLWDDGVIADENCQYEVLMSNDEYEEFLIKASLFDKTEKFNPEAYDIGLYGVIKMFVAGMSIGLILAMLNRLRR